MTTEAKAKELRPYVEKMITQGKEGGFNSKRLLTAKLLNNEKAVKKIMDTLAPRFKERSGGYTRIMKLPARKSDAASMALIEFV